MGLCLLEELEEGAPEASRSRRRSNLRLLDPGGAAGADGGEDPRGGVSTPKEEF